METKPPVNLKDYENIISSAVDNIGYALKQIRDLELWREGDYSSFGNYCHSNAIMSMSERRARQFIAAYDTLQNIKELVETIPLESQLRPLSGLEPLTQCAIWQVARATAVDGKITARHIQACVDTVLAVEASRCIELSNGTQVPIEYVTPQIIAQEFEAIQRQRTHIAESLEPVNEQLFQSKNELRELMRRLSDEISGKIRYRGNDIVIVIKDVELQEVVA